MKRRSYAISLGILAIIMLVAVTEGRRLLGQLSGYLSMDDRVDADVLIVEGWLPDIALQRAGEEFARNGYRQIVTTGIATPPEYFNIHSNGSLIFHTGDFFREDRITRSHSIEVEAHSSLGGSERSHFSLYINSAFAGEWYAEEKKGRYGITWTGDLSGIDSVTIRFDNDRMDETGDRNLLVSRIIADRKISVPYNDNSVYEIITSQGVKRIINRELSGAEIARQWLILAGIDSSLVTAVPASRVRINRTLTSALAFRGWLRVQDMNIKGINIVSMGPHSRRTWMTYNKVLGGRYKTGILTVPYTYDSRPASENRKVIKTLREGIVLLYYRLLLVFY